MSTAGRNPTRAVDPTAVSAAWRRWGRVAGYVAGPAFLIQNVLFLLDVTGTLAPQVGFVDTPNGLMEDLATYYFATNERMHSIWWDVAVRDLLGPIGYLAVMVLVAAVVRVADTRRPRDDLAVLLVVLGGSLGAFDDLMYLSFTHWWRRGGFHPTPTADIVAFGRAADIINNLGTYLQWVGYPLLAVGFLFLAPTLGRTRPGWNWLSWLVRLEAAALVVWVVTDVAEAGTVRDFASIAAGVVLGPAATLLSGQALAKRGSG